ncbi:MAG: hypothetical protein M3081_07470 [Gemmatimonadota bacterium]|nr:hypothetical protein [Gemmatimonadota bacterium]
MHDDRVRALDCPVLTASTPRAAGKASGAPSTIAALMRHVTRAGRRNE